MGEANATEADRKVNGFLALGILFLPFIFSWALLGRGYGREARFVGFGWLGVILFVFYAVAQPSPTGSNDNAAEASWVPISDGVRVRKAGFQSRNLIWPLTVSSVIIGCKHPELLWVEADGTRYGLNGMGQIHLKLDRFDEIWATDRRVPSVPGGGNSRLSPSDLLDEARKLCE